MLYVIIGVLIVVVIGFVIYAYQQEQNTARLEIEVNDHGISIEGNG